MNTDPSNAARDDAERIDELILSIAQQSSFIPRGKTISADMFDAKVALLALLREAREIKPLDFTIDTDENGDYIRFFENGKQRIYGDKAIIRFLYDRLLELSAEKEVK